MKSICLSTIRKGHGYEYIPRISVQNLFFYEICAARMKDIYNSADPEVSKFPESTDILLFTKFKPNTLALLIDY